MPAVDGYHATMLLSEERPDLIPLVRLILEMGDEAFNAALAELVQRGILDDMVLYRDTRESRQ